METITNASNKIRYIQSTKTCCLHKFVTMLRSGKSYSTIPTLNLGKQLTQTFPSLTYKRTVLLTMIKVGLLKYNYCGMGRRSWHANKKLFKLPFLILKVRYPAIRSIRWVIHPGFAKFNFILCAVQISRTCSHLGLHSVESPQKEVEAWSD